MRIFTKKIKCVAFILLCLGSSVNTQAQWIQRGNDIDGEAAGDNSGSSVSLSSDGNILAIGALGNDETGDLAGHVRVYTWNGAAWTQRGDDIDGEAADDRSGGSVSLSSDGNTLAIGATNNDGTDPAAGHVRVYTWNGTAWIQRGSDIDGEARPDQSGGSVSLAADGNTLAIGAARNSGTGAVSGHVRVYEFPFVEIDLKQGSTAIASGETYDFGELATNTSSAEVEFTLENTGNADLELSGTVGNLVVLSGTDADQFLVSQTDVTSPIAAGSEKDFTVSFAPTSEGEKTATLIITSNDTDEGIYTLNLSGNALIPSIPEINLRQSNTTIASGETYDFGELATNTSSTEIDFTLENTGDADLELSGTAGSLVVLAGTDADQFSLSQSDIISPIAAGSNQTFTLSFSPTSEGEKMATLTITSDDADEGTYILNLGGIGVAPLIPEPEINLRQDTTTIASGETYDFGEVDTNTSSSEVAFILENIGDADLEFSGTAGSLVALSGTDADQFSVSQTQVTSPLAAGSDQTFTVSFSPTSEGEKTATLTITSNDADEGTYTLNLSGTSVAVQVGNPEINLRQGNTAIASGETYDFGEVDTNTSSDEVSFTLENAGTADLVLSGVAGSLIVLAGTGADQFSVNQTDIISPITADSSQTFTVTFSPTSEGEKTATLVITSNDADEGTYTFNLSGIGVLPGSPEPEINLRQGTTTIASGETYDFGEVDTNTSSSEVAFILENIGDADLELSGTAGSLVALSGTDADQFSIDQTQVTSPLTAGSDQTFTVSFSPTSEGGKTATLTIISNDADEGTYTLNLSGTGIEIITSLLSTEKESMMVYPNPTRDRVIAKNLPLGKNSFVLTDVLGNTILAGETSNTLELDMSGLTAGTYTLTFTTGEQVFIKKILKY